jgi:hypothetical protein
MSRVKANRNLSIVSKISSLKKTQLSWSISWIVSMRLLELKLPSWVLLHSTLLKMCNLENITSRRIKFWECVPSISTEILSSGRDLMSSFQRDSILRILCSLHQMERREIHSASCLSLEEQEFA